jgi:hypothetical protein
MNNFTHAGPITPQYLKPALPMTSICSTRAVASPMANPVAVTAQMSEEIAQKVLAGMSGIVSPKYQGQMKNPVVAQAALATTNGQRRGKTTLTFTVANAQAAKDIVRGFGPMGDENRLTDNLQLPEGVDAITSRAQDNKVIIDTEWTQPRAGKPKEIERAFGMMAVAVIDTAQGCVNQGRRVSVAQPRVRVFGDDTHGKMTFSFQINDSQTGKKLDANSVKTLAGHLKMGRSALQAQHMVLPGFVRTATATAEGSHLVIEATW